MTTTTGAAPADASGATAAAPGRAPGPTRGAARGRLLVALLVVLFVTVPVVAGLLGTRSSGRALDPDNPAPGGGRALAALLEQGGVPVQRVGTAAAASAALADAGAEGATLVVTDPQLLDPALLTDLVGRSAAVVLLGASPSALEATGTGLRLARDDGSPGSAETTETTVRTGAQRQVASQDDPPGDEPVPAGCDDPAAATAGTVASEEAVAGADAFDASGALVAAGPDGARTTTCFDGLFASGTAPGGARVGVLPQPALLSNELLDEAGDAALGLQAAGSQPEVVWLVASFLDTAPDTAPSPAQLLPGWLVPLAVQLLLAAVAAVVWRARRFGALVVEPLPVVVRSVETARGRAALYRASRDPAGAGGALRAALRWRLQQRLGLPPGTPASVLAAGTAHALRSTGSAGAGRWDAAAVERLLTGASPTDDAALAALLRDVDDLETALAAPPPAPTPSPAPAARTPQTPEDLP